MRIKLISFGHRMPTWINQGYQEYAKRLPKDFRLELIELPLQKRSKHVDLARLRLREGQQMLQTIPTQDTVVTLEVTGQPWSTEKLAHFLQQKQDQGQSMSLLVGGPEGLTTDCLARANERWSLSALTLPHPLVRVIVAEQLYRAWSIIQHHPYHRA